MIGGIYRIGRQACSIGALAWPSIAALATLLSVSPPCPAQQADIVLQGGRIVTVDEDFSIHQAMAVRGDRILAVGTDAEIDALAGPQTRRIPLDGRMVLPGLIDSHVHPTGAATYEFHQTIPEMETVADVLQYVAAQTERLEPGQWIQLRQVFITRLRDQRYPTREELDQVAPEHPVIFSTGPDASLNSLALQLSGIDRDFQLPEGSSGRIERDPKTGEPTGILRGCTHLVPYKAPDPAPTFDQQADALRRLFADYNAAGITSVADRNASGGALRLYEHLRGEGALTCRVFVYHGISPGKPLQDIQQQLDQLREHPLHQYDDRLWLRGVKVFLDGGMLTGSAYMTRPWGTSEIYSITDPDYRGERKIDPEKLYAISREVMKRGFQMTAHAVGDGAVDTLTQVYETIDQQDFPVAPHRPCVTHCNFLTPEAIDRMSRLGIVADLQPAWLERDGATLLKQFGQQRMALFQPYKTMLDAGIVVGGGSDHMQKIGRRRSVNPYDPFWGMWITLQRQPRWSDAPLHPEQRLTREQAIRLYTLNNAIVLFDEANKGSLEAGKLADFVVVDRDLLTCPVDDVKDTQVLSTWVGGKPVYEADN